MSKSRPNPNNLPIEGELSLDRVHHLLSSHQRRYTLYYLYLHENPVDLPAIVDQITEWEQQESPQKENRQQTYIALYHNHLPKLADANVATYCQSEDQVELRENAHQLRPYLEQAAETELNDMTSVHL